MKQKYGKELDYGTFFIGFNFPAFTVKYFYNISVIQ